MQCQGLSSMSLSMQSMCSTPLSYLQHNSVCVAILAIKRYSYVFCSLFLDHNHDAQGLVLALIEFKIYLGFWELNPGLPHARLVP